MKQFTFESEEEWKEARIGKATGSKAKALIPTGGPTVEMIKKELGECGVVIEKGAKKEELEKLLSRESMAKLMMLLDKKAEFWQLLADRLSTAPDEEYPMDRGKRLEVEAIDRFTKETGIEVDKSLVILTRDDDESIAVSPDGLIDKIPELEVKCLKSAKHLEAYFTQQIPDEYHYQAIQYFVVCDELQTLKFAFYDPRVLAKEFFIIEIHRADILDEIEKSLDYQRNALKEINSMVNQLTMPTL
ncbi:MAG: hypothetical protein ACD_51C00320G0001 [uncultured bacterium]|nr:MAG: hypothetical protein ACD_51C00320G0001 [uncultured bacterium]